MEFSLYYFWIAAILSFPFLLFFPHRYYRKYPSFISKKTKNIVLGFSIFEAVAFSLGVDLWSMYSISKIKDATDDALALIFIIPGAFVSFLVFSNFLQIVLFECILISKKNAITKYNGSILQLSIISNFIFLVFSIFFTTSTMFVIQYDTIADWTTYVISILLALFLSSRLTIFLQAKILAYSAAKFSKS